MKFLKTTAVAIVMLLVIPVMAQAQGISKINVQDLNALIASSKGRVLIINFWATWCAPCVKEFPGMVAVRQQYPESDLTMIGISVDYNVRPVENFVKQNKVNFPIYLDNGDISKMMSIKSIPRTLIFNRNGEKVLDHLGYISEESFRHVIEKVRSMP